MSTKSENGADIDVIADKIRHYLTTHPNAADSLEGIVKWWLVRQQYEEAVDHVQKALEQLVNEGVISRSRFADGNTVYTCVKKGESKLN